MCQYKPREMVELCPSVNNITVIHLSGRPNSVLDTELCDTKLKSGNEESYIFDDESGYSDEDKIVKYDEMKYLYNILNENFQERNIYENLRYFFLPSFDISNQNVGISGGVSMVSDPKFLSLDDQQFNSIDDDDNVGPYSLVSVHESVVESLNTFQHYTTITIGKRNESKLSDDSLSDSKSYYSENDSKTVLRASHASQTELIRPVMMHKEMQVCLDNIQYDNTTFEHDFCSKFARDIIAQEIDNDQESLSSFSSAYTVTECELATSDASTNTYFPKEFRNYKLEQNNERTGDSCLDINVNLNILCKTDDENEKYKNRNRTDGEQLGNNFSCNISKIKIKYGDYDDKSLIVLENDYPYLDQRDKSEEEMWVANEATYSQSLTENALQLRFLPLQFPQNGELHPKVQHEGMNLSLSAVPFDQRVSVDVSQSRGTMTAFMPPACDVSLQRKHFTNRQRIGETSTNILVSDEGHEEFADESWNKENQTKNSKGINTTDLTSTLDNRPTKRFSFLVRSNSVEKTSEETKEISVRNANCDVITPKPILENVISASDKAILDRLSELKINQPAVTIVQRSQIPTTPNTSTNITQQTPCGRCGEPVYPQELIKPMEELYFHTACFKCHQCGLRLNLRTFFRSPSPTKDNRNENRIYCRAHLPMSDTRPNYPQNQSNIVDKLKDVVKCDSVGLRYF